MEKCSSGIQSLDGIGKVRAQKMESLGIRTLFDLLMFFPRTYEDRTRMVTIRELQAGDSACFTAAVLHTSGTRHVRKGLDLTEVTVEDHTGRMRLIFYNQRFTAGSLKCGSLYVFYGTVSVYAEENRMINPAFELPGSTGGQTCCIRPVYRLTYGISNSLICHAVRQALDICLPELEELLPDSLRERYQLCTVQEAFKHIHVPPDFVSLAAAERRLAFEEFFVFSAGMQLRREHLRIGTACPCKEGVPDAFYHALPFRLTGAQKRAVDEIQQDMASGRPANRLIQGDTGSGKTMVAAAAAACAASAGLQSALMAPTEILAEQHYASLSPLLEKAGIHTALLTGSVHTAERNQVLDSIADGRIDLVIGTQALLNGKVCFYNLGLVITDEQHRFGVEQRARLAGKGQAPHILLMSATPVPRTLALVIYGDMDISIIDEIPPGRQPVDTFLLGESMRQRVNTFIRRQVQEGHQVFIVCPAVEEEQGETGRKSAVSWAADLQRDIFPDLRISLLHGKMQSAQKEEVMAAFARGESDILVATTVIEVGIDVPNATLMVIENAEYFGLNQLHQLRGRVGRGRDKSWCILFTAASSEKTLERLQSFTKISDGLELACEDLRLRGPGEFLGTRQHGLPAFKCAGLTTDASLPEQAREAAGEFLSNCSPESRQQLVARIRMQFPDIMF